MNNIKVLVFVAIISGIHAAPVLASVSSTDRVDREYQEEDELITSAERLQNPYSWIAWKAVEVIGMWIAGETVDYLADRTGLAEFLGLAENNIENIEELNQLSYENRRRLDELANICNDLRNQLMRHSRSDEEIREYMKNKFNNFDLKMRSIRHAVTEVNEELYILEKRQKKQYRLIVDNKGDIEELENSILDMQGNIEHLRGDVEELEIEMNEVKQDVENVERVVYQDVHYDVFLSGAAAFSSSSNLRNEELIGGQISIQHNLTPHFGIWGGYIFAPLKAKAAVETSDSSIRWDNHVGGGGLMFLPFSPESPVNIQVGVGPAIMQSDLVDYPIDTRNQEDVSGERLSQNTNFGLVMRGGLSIGPYDWNIVPIASFTVLRLRNDINASRVNVSNAGNVIWTAGLGLRLRFTQKGFNDWIDE